MDLVSRLESHPVSTLKKEISKSNIKGYSRMKKNELVKLMLKNKEIFDYIPFNEKSQKSKPKKEPVKKKVIKVKKKIDPKNDNEKVKEFVNKLSNEFFNKDMKRIKKTLSKSGPITSKDVLKELTYDDTYYKKVREFLKNKNQTIYKKDKEGKFLLGIYEDNWTNKQEKEYEELYDKLVRRNELDQQKEIRKKSKK